MLGVTPEQVFEALEVYIGSTYVNDFNFLGRTFRVTLQADGAFRQELRDVGDAEDPQRRGRHGAARLGRELRRHHRALPGAALQPLSARPRSRARPLPGTSTGDGARDAWSASPSEILPDGFAYEWTELALQERQAGDTGLLVFVASVVFVFLLLAAQYESWTAAARRDPDRADVPAGGGQRAAAARHGRQHPRADRLRRAGRARRQERDPDRRVRKAGARSAGCDRFAGRDRGGAARACGRS